MRALDNRPDLKAPVLRALDNRPNLKAPVLIGLTDHLHVVSLISCLEDVPSLGGERGQERLGTHYDTLLACQEMFWIQNRCKIAEYLLGEFDDEKATSYLNFEV